MAVPHWVESVDDYASWLVRSVLAIAGGTLVIPGTGVPAFDTDYYWRGDDEVGSLIALDHRLVFHDGSYLDFAFEVDDLGNEFAMVSYSFHHATAHNTLIWRYDLHEGHADEFGNLAHKHDGDEDSRVPSSTVDLEDVLREIEQRLWPDDRA